MIVHAQGAIILVRGGNRITNVFRKDMKVCLLGWLPDSEVGFSRCGVGRVTRLVWTCRSPFILNGNVGLGAPSLHLSIKVMDSHSAKHQEMIETVVFVTVLFSVNSLSDLLRCCHGALDYGFYPIRAQRRG